MKGIVLSGGSGTRLRPLTKVTSKQLLPIYNKPMVFYPIEKLINAGITEILIIVAPDHCGDYMKLLGSGKEFGVKYQTVYDKKKTIQKGSTTLWNYAENLIEDSVKKGILEK